MALVISTLVMSSNIQFMHPGLPTSLVCGALSAACTATMKGAVDVTCGLRGALHAKVISFLLGATGEALSLCTLWYPCVEVFVT